MAWATKVNRIQIGGGLWLTRNMLGGVAAETPAEPMALAGRLYCLGNALYVLKRYEEAIEAYRESLQSHPHFAECWKNLGSAYHDRDDHGSARGAYEEVLKIEPRKFEALYSLATLLIRHLADPAAAGSGYAG